MFELFSMSLREYWTEFNEESGISENVDASIKELQDALSDYYGKKVEWNEPEVDESRKDEEISVDAISDEQLSALQAVAAKLELDGNLDDFEINEEEPWENEAFDRLAESEEDEENERFSQLLAIGNAECICLPVDLPCVAEINTEEEEEEEHCDCDCEEGCCCEEDDGSVDIASLQALRRELDDLAKCMNLDTSLDIDDDEAMNFEDNPLRLAMIAWYILSARIDESLKEKLPLLIRYNDEEDYDDLEEDDVE